MKANPIVVGNRIKSLRKSKGLTLKEFGELIDNGNPVQAGIISRWENGHSLPNSERIKEIASIGNMTVDELMYGTSEEKIKFIKQNILDIEDRKNNPDYYDVDDLTLDVLTQRIIEVVEKQSIIYGVDFFSIDPQDIIAYTFSEHYFELNPNNQSLISWTTNRMFNLIFEFQKQYSVEYDEYIGPYLVHFDLRKANIDNKLVEEIQQIIGDATTKIGDLQNLYPNNKTIPSLNRFIYSLEEEDFVSEEKIDEKVLLLIEQKSEVILKDSQLQNDDE